MICRYDWNEVSMSLEDARAFLNVVETDLSSLVGELLREQVPKEPTHLYHYTSLEGLVGIVSCRKFFLSDMLASSDQSEILHGLGVVKEVLGEHRGDPIAESFLQSFREDKLWWGIGEHIFDHAICFCEESDVLTQWRAYSPSRGAAIGVNFAELMERATRGEFAFGRMLYERDVQRDIVHRMFTRSRGHFDQLRGKIKGLAESEYKPLLDEFLIVVSQRLLMLALFFKHRAFVSEAEWRILKIEGADSPNLRFRSSGTSIIPYIEFPFEPSLVSEIRCSPGHWSRSALYAIGRLAKSLGNVNVSQSELPI
jgi:hypothetical protein